MTAPQRRLLRDTEGAAALSLLAHLLFARDMLGFAGDFPFAPGFVQRLARRIRAPVGRNESRRIVSRLVTAGVITPVGTYGQQHAVIKPSGFRVPLFRLAHAAWVKNRPRSFAGQRAPRSATSTASVATEPNRKLRPWWEHTLFGSPGGCAPTDVREERLEDWRKPGYLRMEAGREAEFERQSPERAVHR